MGTLPNAYKHEGPKYCNQRFLGLVSLPLWLTLQGPEPFFFTGRIRTLDVCKSRRRTCSVSKPRRRTTDTRGSAENKTTRDCTMWWQQRRKRPEVTPKQWGYSWGICSAWCSIPMIWLRAFSRHVQCVHRTEKTWEELFRRTRPLDFHRDLTLLTYGYFTRISRELILAF